MNAREGRQEERVGRFIDQRIQEDPLEIANITTSAHLLKVMKSEIMREIQSSSNAGALFVLPSQLNAVEYPNEDRIVALVEEYKQDPTAGPRAQLAAHPAAAQFLLDNAATTKRHGICSAGEIDNIQGLRVVNGYLKIEDLQKSQQLRCLEDLEARLNTLSVLAMEDLLATGATPDLKGTATSTHRVGFVYASAVPVDAYLNAGGDVEYQTKVARLMLIGQYYGALKYAAEQQKTRSAHRR